MKKLKLLLWCSSLLFAVTFLSSSCKSNKTGCPINENAAGTGKDGKLSTKRGKSSLFPKKMRRKKRKSRG